MLTNSSSAGTWAQHGPQYWGQVQPQDEATVSQPHHKQGGHGLTLPPLHLVCLTEETETQPETVTNQGFEGRPGRQK